MNIQTQIKHLIAKDLRLEWRQKSAINSVLLYVASAVMLAYMAFLKIEPIAWVTVFWLILLFASVNAVAKSFVQENSEQQRYYYTLASPQAVILSKIIYNLILLLIISLVALLIYCILMGNPVEDMPMFLLATLLGASTFALTFTILAAIAAKASNNATLMPILSFPVIIPMLGLLIKISKAALLGTEDPNLYRDIGSLVAMDVMMLTLAFVLFPYLWRD